MKRFIRSTGRAGLARVTARVMVSAVLVVMVASGTAMGAGGGKPGKGKVEHELPAGHYTGIIRGKVPFSRTSGLNGSGSVVFTGTIDVDIAKRGSVGGTSTFTMDFKYALTLPPGTPAIGGGNVSVSATGTLEQPGTLVGVNLAKHGLKMTGDIKGAGSFTASVSVGSTTGSTSASASGGDSVTITFKAGPGGVTCSSVPAGIWSSPFVKTLVAGLQGSGWKVDFKPKMLRWNLKADADTLDRLHKGPCKN